MDYSQILSKTIKDYKKNETVNAFDSALKEIKKISKSELRLFLFNGIKNIFRDIEIKYPLALNSLVDTTINYIEIIYYNKPQNNFNIAPKNVMSNDTLTEMADVERAYNAIRDIIRTFVDGSKSYYLITNQSRLLKDLFKEAEDEMDIIVSRNISNTFNIPISVIIKEPNFNF